jgi:hypothetical protein
MVSKFLHDLDPLDLEILERAFDGAWTAIKEKNTIVELDSDEELEAVLRRELIDIACFNGVSDPETLRDILVGDLSDRWRSPTERIDGEVPAKSSKPFLKEAELRSESSFLLTPRRT